MAMKKLVRSRKQKMLAGICGGIAEYFNIDATFVRVIFTLILFIGAFFVPAFVYAVLYFIIPESDAWE
jgi:phage shock protein C